MIETKRSLRSDRGEPRRHLHLDPRRAAEMGAQKGHKIKILPQPAILATESVAKIDCVKTAEQVRDVLSETLLRVRGESLDARTASTIAYVATSLLSAIKVADIESRLAKLEQLLPWKPGEDALKPGEQGYIADSELEEGSSNV
jgi:hypothetical protein